jgi:predicted ATP-dependent endonuclease of OLD family|tara:strand:- start:351 stop:2258 length:1908 start_codon:yes stop_codon:yes gene_type:complete
MKIKHILIKNFRSLKEVTIPLNSYGENTKASKTTFLVGLNESGKSAILESINLINKGMKNVDYANDCFIEAQEKDEYIDIYTYLEIHLSHLAFWQKQIREKTSLKEEFTKTIKILEVVKNIYKKNDMSNSGYEVKINDDISFYQYIVNSIEKVVNSKTTKTYTIEHLSEFNKIEEVINKDNAVSFLKENQDLLTKDYLESEIANKLTPLFNANMPKIQIWKSSSEFLINESIDLEEFKDNTELSIPLRNIFHIYGLKNDKEIKSSIEKALKSQARKDELQEKMSDKITRHINKIWKEHKIKIRISINANICKVHVEDKDKKFAYYSMSQRSEGFKQFISLILSLSAQNESNELKNKLILIDEPEVHLHPSGVRYMRDEILKIGKNNNVIVSTHSHYMVDTETPERHWLVQKEKSETTASQISHSANIEDDSVLASAFGLNLFKELLPQTIIIVEGGDDKNVISHCLKLLKPKFFYSIKSAGGASKIPGFARILNDEKINAFIIFDDDKEGRDNKKNILQNQKEFYSEGNVFTLKNILSVLPNDSTIEDLLPINFVKNFFDQEIGTEFKFDENKAIIHQIKNQSSTLKGNKQKLDSLKIKLSIEYCKEFKTKARIEGSTRMKDFINLFYDKIDSFE